MTQHRARDPVFELTRDTLSIDPHRAIRPNAHQDHITGHVAVLTSQLRHTGPAEKDIPAIANAANPASRELFHGENVIAVPVASNLKYPFGLGVLAVKYRG